MTNDILKVLISEEEIKEKVQEMGKQISEDYKDKNLLMVSVLKGSVMIMADLMRAVTIPARRPAIKAATNRRLKSPVFATMRAEPPSAP